MELNFTVTNQKIKYVSNLYIVEKSRNYLTAKFSFSGNEWKNVVKTAIFKKDDTVVNVLLDESGRCNVPWEVITKGTLKVSVFGGDLVTVDTADVKILKSGYEEGNAPSEPTPDVYAQILTELQNIRSEYVTEEMLGQAVEDWLAENVVEALSPEDVEKIVYGWLEEHKTELKGEKGDAGKDGANGVTYTPSVSEDGVLSWTNDGNLENPEPYQFQVNTDDCVPNTRTIAGIELIDDITKEELINALGIYDDTISFSTDLAWGIAGFSSDLSVATPIGYVIPFNSCNDKSNITFDSDNHGFILKAGHTYELESTIRFIGQSGYKYFRFYDNVNKITRGISGGCEVATSASYNDAITPAKLIVTPEVDTLYTIIVDTAANTTGNATFILTSYFKVVELLENIHEGKDITSTTSTTQPNSYAGRENILEIGGGESEQDSTAGNQLWNGKYVTNALNKEQDNFVADSTMAGNIAMPIAVGKQYSLSINGTLAVMRYAFLDSNGNTVTSLTNASTTVVAPENAVYMKWRVNSYHAETDKIMLNEGTTALPYEKYTGGQPAPNPSYSMEIKKTVVSGIRTYWKNIVKSCSYRATATNSYALVTDAMMSIKKGLTYTISVELTADSATKAYWHKGSGIFGLDHIYFDVLAGTHRYSHTFEAQADYLNGGNTFIAKRATSDNVLITPSKLMVELGDTMTEYEPYTESSYTFSQPIELYGRNGVQNILTAKQTKRKFAKRVFDGSESWVKSNSTQSFYLDGITDALPYGLGLCEQFTIVQKQDTSTLNIAYFQTSKRLIMNCDFATLAEWKAHLSSKPMEVVYQLAEEVTEELPIADQIGLNSLVTYDGITHVEFIYEGPQPTFKGEYGTSKVGGYTLESLLTARNNDLRLSALELSVVNNI